MPCGEINGQRRKLKVQKESRAACGHGQFKSFGSAALGFTRRNADGIDAANAPDLNDAAPGQCPDFGARLCEPQHVGLQIRRLRVADPRSVFKSGHYPLPTELVLQLDFALQICRANGALKIPEK
jgi:hypothetical protein